MPTHDRKHIGTSIQSAEISGIAIEFAAKDSDLWFSHGAVARILHTTTQNIVIHLRDLRLTESAATERFLRSEKIEGNRVVRRRIKHVNLATAASIAMRARRYLEYDWLLALGRRHGIRLTEIRINAVKERDFGQLLEGLLAGITPILRQFRVGSYRIDFVLPEFHLAVEYDELHHDTPRQLDADVKRQADIVEERGFEFLRIHHGAEIEGLNAILRHIVESKLRNRSSKDAAHLPPVEE